MVAKVSIGVAGTAAAAAGEGGLSVAGPGGGCGEHRFDVIT